MRCGICLPVRLHSLFLNVVVVPRTSLNSQQCNFLCWTWSSCTCMTTETHRLHKASRAYMMWHRAYSYHSISPQQVLLLYCPKCYGLTAPVASDYIEVWRLPNKLHELLFFTSIFCFFGTVVWVKRNTQLWCHIHGFPNFRHPIVYLFAA